jgi:hypothetical protein
MWSATASKDGRNEMAKKDTVVGYSSNNSGGSWWLTDEDWEKLEAAGWEVEWRKDDGSLLGGVVEKAGDRPRFLGAAATEASRRGLSLRMADIEWEEITGQNANEEGCPCCGQPHNFYERDWKE